MGGAPLSILHVDLSESFGGTERYVVDLAARQAAQRHRVGIAGWKASPILDHVPPGVTAHALPRFFTSRGIAHAAARQGAEIVNAHLPVSARAARALRTPAVLTLHLRYKAKETRGMDGLICVAEWQELEAQGYPGPKITAYNWPPALKPADPARVAEARHLLGAQKDTFVVGFIARLHRIKRADLLIDAYRQAALPNAVLAIVGDGPERKRLEARAADPTIRFLGHRDDAEVWHRAADLFVLPSDWEGLPLGILEAMTAGKPILATASEGSAEALRGSRATLVPRGDSAALARGLREAHAGFSREGTSSPSYDLSRFDSAVALARIERFYRDVIAVAASR